MYAGGYADLLALGNVYSAAGQLIHLNKDTKTEEYMYIPLFFLFPGIFAISRQIL